MSWLTEEAFKTPAKKDRIILENPEVVKHLDERILTVFWPFIRKKQEKSGFAYIPVNEDYEITSTWGGLSIILQKGTLSLLLIPL